MLQHKTGYLYLKCKFSLRLWFLSPPPPPHPQLLFPILSVSCKMILGNFQHILTFKTSSVKLANCIVIEFIKILPNMYRIIHQETLATLREVSSIQHLICSRQVSIHHLSASVKLILMFLQEGRG